MTSSNRSAEIAALYQELILDHYRRPRNKGELEGATRSVTMKNPLCGDEVALHVLLDGDKISDLKFSGRGCSISQASASMMTQLVKGKSTTEQVRSGNSAACEGKSRHAVHLAFIAYCAREICEIRLPSPAVRLGPIAG